MLTCITFPKQSRITSALNRIRKTRINLKRVLSISIDQHPKGSAPFMNTMTLETESKKKFIRSKSYSFIFDSEAQKIMIV